MAHYVASFIVNKNKELYFSRLSSGQKLQAFEVDPLCPTLLNVSSRNVNDLIKRRLELLTSKTESESAHFKKKNIGFNMKRIYIFENCFCF